MFPIKNLLKSIGLGIVDSIPVVSSIKNNIMSNHLKSEINPADGIGRVDYSRLITTSLVCGLIVAYVLRKISIEDFKYFYEILNK